MLETGWNCLYMVPPPHCFRLFPFNQKASVQDENWRMVYTLQWTSLPNNRRWKRKILPTSNLEQPTFVLSQSTSLRSCRGQHPSKKVVWGWDRCCASDGWPSDQVVNPKQRFCWLIMFKRFQKYGLFVEMELDRHNLLHALEAKGDWESHVGSHCAGWGLICIAYMIGTCSMLTNGNLADSWVHWVSGCKTLLLGVCLKLWVLNLWTSIIHNDFVSYIPQLLILRISPWILQFACRIFLPGALEMEDHLPLLATGRKVAASSTDCSWVESIRWRVAKDHRYTRGPQGIGFKLQMVSVLLARR